MTVIENSSTPTLEHVDASAAHPVVRMAFAALVIGAAGVVMALCLLRA